MIHQERPVELRKGVLCRGEFHYREHNSGAAGVETFAEMHAEDREDLLLEAAEELALRGEQVLVFAPARMETVKLAQALATRLRLPPLSEAIAELGEEEETQAQGALREVLGGSVAYHNSDLSAEERRIVERHFRSGGIRVLVSTATLAVGMNLPAKNVIIDGRKWKYLKRYKRHSLVDVGKSEYENMSGRAGRLSFATDFGRSILVTKSPFHRDVWMRNYVGADFEPIQPRLMDAPLENHVLNLLTSGLTETIADLENLLLESFTGFVHWRQAMSREQFAKALEDAVELCKDGGLVRDEGGGHLTVTQVGEACAKKGIDVQTGRALMRWAHLAKERPVKALEILTRVGGTHAGRESYVPLSRDEKYEIDYRSLLFARIRVDEVADRELFERIADTKMAIEYVDALAVKKALVLADWIAETSIPEIEQTYRVSGGIIRRIGSDYAWLVEGLGEIAKASGWSQERCRVFEVLAERLVHGVKADALPLARMRVPSLRRSQLRALVRAGLADPETLRRAHAEVIQGILDHETAFGSLAAHLGLGSGTLVRGSPVADSDAPPVPALEPILAIDLHNRRVVFHGRAIPSRGLNNLQRQPFFALARLAEQPGTMVSMESIARYVHDKARLRGIAAASEARDLRYRIVRAFRHHLPPEWSDEIEELIEVVQGVGLRLNARGTVRVVESPANTRTDVESAEPPKLARRPAKARRRSAATAALATA